MKRAELRLVENEMCTFLSENQGGRILVCQILSKSNFKDHEHIFWLGDLNYRIDLDRKTVIEAAYQGNFSLLHKHDQLLKQRSDNFGFALRDF
jgi:hypothetical protein